ncbi:hypothetical protein SYNPS1DRAFT_29354 [Syncephalis pseudoplumigaleata]|uniref:Uncharacterized protein n=1 Tax=Syncephalis pseudoplumigaleata TaxID=1712513 RepID=A0A4P9Z0M0_9FUNG|nr:hypothetical protein SYNPS1DRAFT_29354 [Syncephalis pseudoplumigaleata]|eukprot:RKP24900.1 hypothetical protein SYNPS1DRAFT_29354 [Syncephalis pseudoplumigaleata]
MENGPDLSSPASAPIIVATPMTLLTPTSTPTPTSTISTSTSTQSDTTSTSSTEPAPTGPAPTFTNGDAAARAPSRVGGLSVPSLVAICISSLIVAAFIAAVLIVWIRRRQRVQNARFEGAEEQQQQQQKRRHSGSIRELRRSINTTTIDEPVIARRGHAPASPIRTSRPPLTTVENVETSTVIFNQNDYIVADTMVNSNAIALPKSPVTHERRSASGSSTPTDEFHATRARHSVQNVNFDPEALLEATGRHSRSSTVVLDLDGGNSRAGEHAGDRATSINNQRRLSRPLSMQHSSDMPQHDVHADMPLDADEITKRQPTLPDLSAIAGDIALFAPMRPRHASQVSTPLSPSHSPYRRQDEDREVAAVQSATETTPPVDVVALATAMTRSHSAPIDDAFIGDHQATDADADAAPPRMSTDSAGRRRLLASPSVGSLRRQSPIRRKSRNDAGPS